MHPYALCAQFKCMIISAMVVNHH